MTKKKKPKLIQYNEIGIQIQIHIILLLMFKLVVKLNEALKELQKST